MAEQRLDKLLGHLGQGSRREIAALCRRGEISVNGEICKSADCKIDPERDKLTVSGEALTYRSNWYIMLNKPIGVVTATRDNFQQTVLELLPEGLQKIGLFPVGRLDKDTDGLLLLTTDGAFSHALTAPRREVDKVYIAEIAGTLMPDAASQFVLGLTLADGTVCQPAKLEVLQAEATRAVVRVTLHEGKFHQVKRMLLAVGGVVTALRRIAIGSLALDEALAPGAFRELTISEIAALRALTEKR